MKKLISRVIALFAAVLISGSAQAVIDYHERFNEMNPDTNDLAEAGWKVFGNVFDAFPGCGASAYLYGYGPFPAPNAPSNPAFSFIVTTGDGQAINVFSDYNNGDHANGKCIEANVFQERVFSAADAAKYVFIFEVIAPVTLGEDVSTYGFVKLIDPAAGWATVFFETVDTSTEGYKSILVDLDASADGMILQWGFASQASNYGASGRWYDNVSFSAFEPRSPRPEGGADSIPTLGTLGLLLLLVSVGGVGVFVLARRS